MSQPTPNDGSTQMAMVQVETAQQMLEQACASLPRDSKQYSAAEKALKALSKDFPRQRSGELVNAQLAEMARAQQQAPVAQFMGSAPQGAQPQMQAA
jgi:hypothetical protein